METSFFVKPASAMRERVAGFIKSHRIGVLTLLFTDIVDSTRLKQELGDLEAVALIQAHHGALRDLLGRFPEGEEIETAGDSFFIVFAKPSEATKFAVLWQARLRRMSAQSGHAICDRIGIHVGEVFIEQETGGKDLYGMQVDTSARVMSLAQGGQILLTRFAFDNARQLLRGQELEGVTSLAWMHHGSYVMKGVEDPLEICEVGEHGLAPLTAPKDSEKARRNTPLNEDLVLGWRPAIGELVPETAWVLQEKLGEGAFGEVWLAENHTLKQKRVFKFCFRADRVCSLKREVTLFRLLQEQARQHQNIVAVEDVYLEKAPFYIVTEYVSGRDLVTWVERKGGTATIPVSRRLEIIAQVADALQVAHGVGVLHRDVKPSNILIDETSNEICSKLCDFGVGQVVSDETFANVTRLGFTETTGPGSMSGAGTHLYMAPELFAGKRASVQSDIYSLGVVLYQFLVGDWTRPLTMDWIRHIDDPLLREDLVRCFAGDPADRFNNAGELSQSLRAMDGRRAAEDEKIRKSERELKRTYLFSVLRKVAFGAVVFAAIVSLFLLAKEARAGRYGGFEIQTFPAGAGVWSEGKQLGVTPYQAERITPGDLTFSLRLTNYETVETKVTVKKRNRAQLLVFLSPRATGVQPVPVDSTNTAQITAPSVRSASLLKMEGTVEMMLEGDGTWHPARLEMGLIPGDRIRTRGQSGAVLQLATGGTVQIGANSVFTLGKSSSSLDAGKIYITTPKGTNRFEIRTPRGIGSVRG